MIRKFSAMSALVLLVGCGDGQPFTFGGTTTVPVTPDPTIPLPIPAALRGNLNQFVYNPALGLLSVEMRSLDRVAGNYPLADYNRNAALDVPGYTAYSYQDDPLDRLFIAIVARSADEAVEAGAVVDGGQFNRFFGGSYYGRTAPYTPETGLVSYAGSYAGLTNISAPAPNQLQDPTPVTNPDILPTQSSRVTGDVFINADFGDNTINGTITNRMLVDYGLSIPTVVLVPTDIVAAGTFGGIVEKTDLAAVGTYGGIFGGTNATSVAGTIHLDGDFIPSLDNEEEYGLFVLTKCGQPSSDPICAIVTP